jgi:nucleotidyltransferase/DNA polymerase involved in DNA repair
MRLLHLYWPHLPLDLARARHSGSFPEGPVVLGGQPWTDGTVLDADPLARALGVRRGMPLGSAHRLAPEAAFLDPDPAADAAVVEEAFRALAAFSPGLAGTSASSDPEFGLLAVQVDGLDRLWGPEPVLVRRLVDALRPVLPTPARAGIAGTRFTATVAAAHASPGADDPTLVPPGGDVEFLAPLPAALLSPDPEIRARLTRFGLRRIAQVAQIARSALVARFGEEGARIHARASGHEIVLFRPRRAPERLALGLPIDPPTDATDALRFVLHRLAGTLAEQLRGRGVAATTARLRLDLELAFAPVGTSPTRAVEQRFPEPTTPRRSSDCCSLASSGARRQRPSSGSSSSSTGSDRRPASSCRCSCRRRSATRGSAGSLPDSRSRSGAIGSGGSASPIRRRCSRSGGSRGNRPRPAWTSPSRDPTAARASPARRRARW